MKLKADPAEIAKIALKAFIDGHPMSSVVADHRGVTRRYASSLISQARRGGFDIPDDRKSPWMVEQGFYCFTHQMAPQVGGAVVLRCACLRTFDSVKSLAEHTHTDHWRAPSNGEKTPLTKSAIRGKVTS